MESITMKTILDFALEAKRVKESCNNAFASYEASKNNAISYSISIFKNFEVESFVMTGVNRDKIRVSPLHSSEINLSFHLEKSSLTICDMRGECTPEIVTFLNKVTKEDIAYLFELVEKSNEYYNSLCTLEKELMEYKKRISDCVLSAIAKGSQWIINNETVKIVKKSKKDGITLSNGKVVPSDNSFVNLILCSLSNEVLK